MNHKCTPPGGNTTAGAELSAERRAYLRQVRRQKQEITLWRAGVLVGLLLLWEIAARLGWIDSFIMGSPSRILDTLFSLADNQILMHFSVTLYETLTGFVIGAFGGLLLAILLWTALLCYARMLCTMLCIYAACMVGHLFRAHNGVASVGAFFLMSWGQGRVENLLNAGGFVRILMGSAGDTIVSEAANHSMLIFFAASFAITAVFGAVYFILTCWLMKNKLNLE